MPRREQPFISKRPFFGRTQIRPRGSVAPHESLTTNEIRQSGQMIIPLRSLFKDEMEVPLCCIGVFESYLPSDSV